MSARAGGSRGARPSASSPALGASGPALGAISPSIGASIVALVAMLMSLPSLANGLFWDDAIVLERQLPAIGGVTGAFFPPVGLTEWGTLYYRPLVTVSFLIDRAIWGANPFGFHLTVLLIHALASVALFALARRIAPGAGALVAALLFAVHPVHAEAVGWISGRADVIAALLGFVALLASLASPASFRASAGALVVIGLASAGAVLAKEPAAILPLMVAIVAWCVAEPAGGSLRRLVPPQALASAAGVAGVVLLRFAAIGGPARVASRVAGGAEGLAGIPAALAFAARRLLCPWTWSGFHAITPPIAALDLAALAALLALGAIAWTISRTGRVAALLTAAAMVPVLAPLVVNVSSSPLADRYLYMPSAGLCLLVGVAFGGLLRRSRGSLGRTIAWLAAATGLLLLAFWNVTAVARYRDDATFWRIARERAPEDGYVALQWGKTLLLSGQRDAARTELRRATELPGSQTQKVLILDALAQTALAAGDLDEAEKLLGLVTRSAPGYASGQLHEAQLWRQRARAAAQPKAEAQARAEASLARALAIEPGNLEALLLRAQLALDAGRRADAARDLESLIPKMPEGPGREKAREILEGLRRELR